MATAPRIVSLVPAATDIVAALGRGGDLVGVSHECDHLAASNLPVVTSAAIPAAGLDTDTDPAWVDAQVSAAIDAGQALYRTDLELLHHLQPTVIIGQGICDVCAVSAHSVADQLPDGARLVTLTATSIAGLWDDVSMVGLALGVESEAEALCKQLQARLDAAAAAAIRSGPTVVALEWGDPPFVGGHWIPELVEIAGGQNVLGQSGAPSLRCTWGQVVDAAPDVIVYMPCGYTMEVAVAEAERLFAPLGLAERVWVADAGRLFSRCTPVVAEAVEALAAAFAGRTPVDGLRRLV